MNSTNARVDFKLKYIGPISGDSVTIDQLDALDFRIEVPPKQLISWATLYTLDKELRINSYLVFLLFKFFFILLSIFQQS